MSDTVFVDQVTPIVASWLNDINVVAYRALAVGGTAPATASDVRSNLGLTGASGAGYVGFSPAAGLTSNTVQAALVELKNLIVPATNSAYVSIASLRAYTGYTDTQVAIVSGYYASNDGGGGIFIYSATSSATDDNGLVIKPTSVSGNGRWLRLVTDVAINVKWYGAKGDGVTDDAVAIQSAINQAKAVGGNIELPAGDYYCNSTLTITETGTTDAEKKCSIIGAGPAVSRLLFGAGATDGITVTGNWSGAGMQSYQTISGLALERVSGAGIGLKITNIAFCSIIDVKIIGWQYGMYLIDSLSSRLESVILRFNTYGMRAEKVSNSNPNAITMEACVISNNIEYGIWAIAPATFNMFGGSVENNGVGGSGATLARFGILINNAGAEGGVGCNFSGVYFEGNSGQADIYINNTSNSAAHNITGCSFNRISNTAYVEHNIYAEASSAYCFPTISGCGFKRFNTYVANSSRKYIDTNGSVNVQVTYSGNYYYDFVEAPTVANTLMIPGVKASVRCDGAGNVISGQQSSNIASVSRGSAGVYIVSFSPALQKVQGVSVTVSRPGGSANPWHVEIFQVTTTQADIRIFNGTTPTDSEFSLVVV